MARSMAAMIRSCSSLVSLPSRACTERMVLATRPSSWRMIASCSLRAFSAASRFWVSLTRRLSSDWLRPPDGWMTVDWLRPGGLVLRGHGHDAVGVDLERDLDLRHTLGRGRDVGQLEPRQALVVRGHVGLALQDVELDLGLVVGDGGEDAALARGDRAVALDDRRERAVLGLDTHRVRGDVEEDEVLDLAGQDAGLDGGAHGDPLVGVHRAVGLALEDAPDDVGDPRARVWPPTSRTSSICSGLSPASESAAHREAPCAPAARWSGPRTSAA